MEPTTHEKPQQFTPTGGTNPLSRDVNSAAEKGADAARHAADAARHATDQISAAAAEKFGQAKQKVGEVYNEVNRSVNEQYNKAVDYSRENPGKTTLIAFGVGVGVGLLLVGNLKSSRRSRGRVVEPVITALSTLAYDLFA